jgi:hypothetical protein
MQAYAYYSDISIPMVEMTQDCNGEKVTNIQKPFRLPYFKILVCKLHLEFEVGKVTSLLPIHISTRRTCRQSSDRNETQPSECHALLSHSYSLPSPFHYALAFKWNV